MHLAYPPRKNSTAAKYMPRQKLLPRVPRNKRTGAAILLVLMVFGWLMFARGGRRQPIQPSHPKGVADHVPSGKPPVVIVTVLDTSDHPKMYIDSVKENRKRYAELHGYGTLVTKVGDYDLHGSSFSWTKVVAMRHAIAKYPDAKWIWYVHEDAFIMDPKTKFEHLVADKVLDQVMIKGQSLVPPNSIIKTFSHTKGKEVDLVLTQDQEGISLGSFAIRNTEWAKFLLDTWYDPMYRNYNFQKAELHAMEHILQWHPTILSKLALVPQRHINSYGEQGQGDKYQEGDLVVRFPSCTKGDGETSCAMEASRVAQKWRTAFPNGS